MPTAPALNRPPKARSACTTKPSSAARSSQASPSDEATRTRLHITPFSPALLKTFVPPSLLQSATNISYHSVQTFPEKGFGYVELPTMEAQKLKKKLNGSILKGSKIRIEDAKPEKRKVEEKDETSILELEVRLAKRAKKEEKKDGVLPGFELPDKRKVKRGWTEPPVQGKAKIDKDKKDRKDKKEKLKESKYTKDPEMLFRTKLTPVAAAAASSGKAEKIKDKKKSKNSRGVVVHEFSKTTKHASFLKSNQISKTTKPATEYVDGKGWVDEDGDVVEAETRKARRSRVIELAEAPKEVVQIGILGADEEASSSKDEDASKAKISHKSTNPVAPPADSSESMTSSSDETSSVISSSSGSESESESASQASSSSVSSSIPTKPLQNVTITPASPHEIKEVHPLEALFKRPQPPMLSLTPSATPTRLAPINTSFSFFGDENADADMDTGANPPHTPFTRQDLQWRELRSAAPTPDTAAIGGRFTFPWENNGNGEDDEEDAEAGAELNDNTKANAATYAYDGEDEEEEGDMDMADANLTPLGARTLRSGKSLSGAEGEENGEGDESAFAKWFWEHRGENNRAWKKRRREALKVKRQRENRRVGRKVV
ncbi:hypothetical protein AOQ84DRAFT_283982 [Glonium stellatum]|uniref:RRM domain-containing protein n=1 Tax=Glonium stellatum TaxID=574774 RepID=A0A8E2F9V1_9PEZI|nr:hypothetical protein AOQ84DRAFT_283982 [Glonium stellatum]